MKLRLFLALFLCALPLFAQDQKPAEKPAEKKEEKVEPPANFVRKHTMKIGGADQDFVSMTASQFFGRMRGKLSIKPPPVIWARPLIIPRGTLANSD